MRCQKVAGKLKARVGISTGQIKRIVHDLRGIEYHFGCARFLPRN